MLGGPSEARLSQPAGAYPSHLHPTSVAPEAPEVVQVAKQVSDAVNAAIESRDQAARIRDMLFGSRPQPEVAGPTGRTPHTQGFFPDLQESITYLRGLQAETQNILAGIEQRVGG